MQTVPETGIAREGPGLGHSRNFLQECPRLEDETVVQADTDAGCVHGQATSPVGAFRAEDDGAPACGGRVVVGKAQLTAAGRWRLSCR